MGASAEGKAHAYSYQYSYAPNPYWSSLYAPGSEIRAYLKDVADRFGASRFIKTSHDVERCVWNDESKTCADLRNKRVGVIGNASSAIQIVPQVQKLEGTKIWCFTRSPTWISMSYGDAAMAKLGLNPEDTTFSRKHQERLAQHPDEYFKVRKVFETDTNMVHPITIRGSEMQLKSQAIFTDEMQRRLEKRPDLFAAMIPVSRRGYLEALQKENVKVLTQSISRVTEKGITLDSGDAVELDTIICATGFRVSAPPTFEVVGRGGQTLGQRWSPRIESYLSMAVDGFPNFFMVGGPNSGVGTGSLTIVLQQTADYAIKAMHKAQKEDYASIEVKAERVADFSAFVDEYFKRTVYVDDCSSWYRGGKKGGHIFTLWPGSTLHCIEALRAPRWEDYHLEPIEPAGNSLRWLGNGWSQTQLDGDPAWYIEPQAVDPPIEGKPEEKEQFRMRPFSH
ncbi:uncharacterized protein B0I36DRAFT_408469 [Microdochium trichocladiopsis]|uniref:Uncharacterized protein n=1 Tax=Microdochium trichocladiopsis TaxID=1682393 RepID=A0A9P9BSI0_9PEZI|nr:uncharacterized protein B0I36DRAFT_408469 [Microdochium trichocladiopsis]KAH7033748.1 hypothetical protein B0I36DRAFT_408469 [Microdochium trichocladiopsis]